jgi:tRNA threonylcarbamoyladenosine biosynthesis protein TsaB
MKGYFLVIDTSSMLGLCAVAERDKGSYNVVFERYIDAKASHSEHLFIGIQEALSKKEISLSDIETIVYTAGPGSFTGLRIAYSAVKGFTMASGIIKSHGVSTLKALMYNVRTYSGYRMVLIKGSADDVYALVEDKNGNVVVNEGCYDIKYIMELLIKVGVENVACIGSGALFYRDALMGSGAKVNVPKEEKLHNVNPLGMLSLLELKSIDDINYLKASYAEIKAAQK